MDTQQIPRQADEGVPQDPVPTPVHSSFWRKYRWPLLGLIALIVIGASLAVYVAKHNDQPVTKSAKAPVSTSLINPAPPTPSTTNSNHWSGTVSATAIPLGDGHVSTTPQMGYVDSCTTTFNGSGSRHAGNWINTATSTWNSAAKVAVAGSVDWSAANYTETTNSTSRLLTTDDLPRSYPTGIFPISAADPAYQYDTNPNHIGAQSLSYTLPLNPTAAASPSCLPLGPIGVMSNGVLLFNALDAAGRDAVAHETQDLCDGHPDGQEMYHYHDVPSCMRSKATGSSTLVGYAFDGYGIYVEHDSSGNLPTNADLDACHGRTSAVMWNGKLTTIYHYDATLEYPYTIGCFHGSPISAQTRKP